HAATGERLHEAWTALEAQRQRAADEWAEANRYFAEQSALLDVRLVELTSREKAAADRHAQIEAETAGMRAECATLDLRIQHTRAGVAELEARRDRAHADLLAIPAPLVFPPASQPLDIALKELLLAREKERVAALKASLDREMADVDDRRRLVTEQMSM